MKIDILKNKRKAIEVVEVHVKSFKGFFLTFLGKGFLKGLYEGFMEHDSSGLIATEDEQGRVLGFLAYSDDLSGFYKYLLKTRLIAFAWYAFLVFVKKPKIMFRLLRAFMYSNDAKREERYIELSSIGVLPEYAGIGIGSKMIDYLKKNIDANIYEYIKLETDTESNESANRFYQRNGFELEYQYETKEHRKMNEYHYILTKEREKP